jgi:hypothetical protein
VDWGNRKIRGESLGDPRNFGHRCFVRALSTIVTLLFAIAVSAVADSNPGSSPNAPSQAGNSELSNMSTRGFVLSDDNVMIGGFVLGRGSNTTEIVVRGIGPSLAGLGIDPILADPALELYDGNGSILVANDDWQDNPAQASELISRGLAPQNAKEAAVVMSLPPGAFTALLGGRNGGTGIGLVELYNVH